MNRMYKLADDLKVTIEEELAGANTSKETIEDMNYYIETLTRLWEQYKKDNDLL